ncbi:MAG: hypothetical protein LC790_01025 [Actinobacteria bacterium]|jgi:hypothetical protein|nr:hypothetical protein [Actinomycetota bacterium]
MAEVAEETVIIRHIQGLTALLACLPAGGKVRELFSLALALDEGPVLDKIGPPSSHDEEGLRVWLEALWAEDGITPDEQKIVDWQKDSANMAGAIAEFKDVGAKVSPNPPG